MKKNNTKFQLEAFLAVLMAVLTLVCSAAAEEKPAPTPVQSASPGLLSPVQQRMEQTISIDFSQTPIEDVLKILAKQADVDIVKSPKVTGNVTATLTDIPLAEALTNILSAHGYSYITTKNMIRVIPTDEIAVAREPMVNRVYRITYADVTEVEKALKKFVSDTGSLSANPGTSNIIVTDTESKIKAIDSFIEEIDRITPQILVEAKIYDVTTTDSLDIGVDWQLGTNTTIGSTFGENPTAGKTDAFATSLFGGVSGYTESSGQIRFGILNDNIDIDTKLKLLQEAVTAKLLASPSILSLDNEKADFKIISQIPYQELTETSAGGTIGTTAFREVGVELTVVPHVTHDPKDGKDGMIRLHVQPKFSVATSAVQVGNSNINNAQPVVDSRQADIVTLLRDGQTIVIAGLRKKDIKQRLNKIPLLGDIPLVGFIFRSEGEETINSQLFVFITAKIIQNQILPVTEAQSQAITELNMKDIPSSIPLRVDRTK